MLRTVREFLARHRLGVVIAVVVLFIIALMWPSAPRPPPLVLDAGLQARLERARSVAECAGYPNAIAARCAALVVPHVLDAALAAHAEWRSPCVAIDLIRAWAAAVAVLPIWDPSSRAPLNGEGGMWDWDMLLPLVRCPGESRVGVPSDGGKWTCLPLRTPPAATFDAATCLIYSFGVSTDPSFELALHARLGCETHSFDPTPDLPPPYPTTSSMAFHAWGLSNRDGQAPLFDGGPTVQMYTLPTIMRRLTHTGRHVAVMKMDIEGSEWDALAPFYAGGGGGGAAGQLFDQLLVELHVATDRWSIMHLVVGLLEAGYLPFHKELNGGNPRHLTEASWVSVAWLAAHEPACAVPS